MGSTAWVVKGLCDEGSFGKDALPIKGVHAQSYELSKLKRGGVKKLCSNFYALLAPIPILKRSRAPNGSLPPDQQMAIAPTAVGVCHKDQRI